LEQETSAPPLPVAVRSPAVVEDAERAARRSLRAQIARLEREFADAFVTAYSMGGVDLGALSPSREPRMLDLGELEQVRDELAERSDEITWTLGALPRREGRLRECWTVAMRSQTGQYSTRC